MIRGTDDPINNPQRLRERIQAVEKDVARMKSDDTVIDSGRLLKLRAPNGHYYTVTVSNAGALVLTDVGTTL